MTVVMDTTTTTSVAVAGGGGVWVASSNDGTGHSTTGITRLLGFGIPTTTQVIDTIVNDDASTNDGPWLKEGDEWIEVAHVHATCTIRLNLVNDQVVEQVASVVVQAVILEIAVLLIRWIPMRTSRLTTLGQVTKLVNVTRNLAPRVQVVRVKLQIKGHQCRRLSMTLLKPHLSMHMFSVKVCHRRQRRYHSLLVLSGANDDPFFLLAKDHA